MNAGAIRAGLAVVELSADMGPLNAALNQAAARLKGWSGQIAKMGVGLGGLGLSIAGPILGAFKSAVDHAAAMDTLALQMGTTTEKASRLAYALGTVGIEEGEVVQFSKHLAHAFSSAADGSHEAVQEFTRLGLNWQELAKMDPTEQFLSMHEAIGKVTNSYDRLNQAKIFGRAGPAVLRLTNEELRKRLSESDEIGATTTAEMAASAKDMKRIWSQISGSIKFAMMEIGRALLPHVKDMRQYAKTVVDVVKGVRVWISENKPLVVGVLGLGVAITAAGVALIGLGVIGASVTGVITGIASAVAVAGTALGAVFTPLGLGLAAVGAVVAGLGLAYYYADEKQRAFMRSASGVEPLIRLWPQLSAEGVRAWGTIREAGVSAWGGIVSAFKRGDLKSAWAITLAGLDVVWEQLKASSHSVWATIRDDFLDSWQDGFELLRGMFLELAASLAKVFDPIAEAVMNVNAVIFGALSAMNAMISAIMSRVAAMASRLGGTQLAKRLGLSVELTEFGAAAGEGADEKKPETFLQRHIREAKAAADLAREARAKASAADRERRDEDVRAARESLRELLDEEKKKAAVTGKGGLGGEGLGGTNIQQAAREVRGSFAGFSSSAQAQQQFAVGSSPWQRQLVDVNQAQLGELQNIRAKIEGPPVFN